jgi:uncharacterized protein
MKNTFKHNNISISYMQEKFGSDDSEVVLYLHGLMSDMHGYKAQKIRDFCKDHKLNFVAFDNAGHGNSGGEFLKMNMSIWIDTCMAVIEKLELKKIIIVGSSRGGWVSLCISAMNKYDIIGLVLLAPAPDFTEDIYTRLTQLEKNILNDNSVVRIKQTEDFPGILITRELIEDGKNWLLLTKKILNIDASVIIIHGMEDKDVGYKRSILLNEIINSPFICLKILKHSGHRLNGDLDIFVILNSLNELIAKKYTC